MLIRVPIMRIMEMAIVEIIGVTLVCNGSMPTLGTVVVFMSFVNAGTIAPGAWLVLP